MATTPEYAAFILGQLEEAGEITSRKMFGGVGGYIDGTFCVIIDSNDRFYLRTGPGNIEPFEEAGMEPFMDNMPYHEVPEDVVENPGVLAEWAREARDAARAAKKKKG